MSKLAETGAAVQHLAKQYAAVIELGKFLDEAGSLDNLKSELEAQIAKLRADAVTAAGELQTAHEEVAKVLEASQAVTKDARQQAADIIAAAEFQAGAVLSEAEKEAARVKQAASDAEVAAANAVAESRTAKANLEMQIDAKRDELAKLEAAIAEVRAKLGV